jgi:hypothetical protein
MLPVLNLRKGLRSEIMAWRAVFWWLPEHTHLEEGE